MGFFLLLANLTWNQIDVRCVVRGIANLTQDRVQVLEAGQSRPITSFARSTGKAHVVTVDSPDDAYMALMRRFDDADERKVLVISGESKTPLTAQHRWELILLALRTHVAVYGAGGMAEETGGRVTTTPREIQADLDAEYHIIATPLPRSAEAGAYHALAVRVAGFRAQAPRSYYITPPWDD